MSRHKHAPRIYPDLSAAQDFRLPLPRPVVDSHTHVPTPHDPNRDDYADDDRLMPIQEIADRMDTAGVGHAVISGCEYPVLNDYLDVAHADPGHFSVALAIHPNEAPLHERVVEPSPDGMTHGLDPWHEQVSLSDALSTVADLARDPAVVAIGETGLDFFRVGDRGRDIQKKAFAWHIALAKELDLPVQIHDRNAHRECVEVLDALGAPDRVIFHAFSGDAELAEILASRGWYASFGGTLSFKSNSRGREAFRAMPSDLILVETDAPYLTPEPFRGRPNMPYLAAVNVRHQAAVRGVGVAEWCDQLVVNTEEAFGTNLAGA
ncbi:MAG: TatD family hydrolase [Actinomycetaceae bacterium]|nr:TatD family hydrolase [Actinomycetaceae bacterium]MDY6083536.1 TatD family hydrolase [Actinomycetaceae bacterium]